MNKNTDKFNVKSFNQKGGITAGVVNISNSKPQRRMNDQVGESLKSKIPKQAIIKIMSALGDEEADTFAYDIKNWMIENGYQNVSDVSLAAFSHSLTGQGIRAINDNEYEIHVYRSGN